MSLVRSPTRNIFERMYTLNLKSQMVNRIVFTKHTGEIVLQEIAFH